MNSTEWVEYLYPKNKKGTSPDEELPEMICIDPGLGGTGIAIFPATKRIPDLVPKPEFISGVNGRAKGFDWLDECKMICAKITDSVPFRPTQLVVIEMPGLFSGSAVSQAAAARGDLFKLSILVGMLIDTAIMVGDMHNICLVPPQRWKGQLTKQAVRMRIKRAYGSRHSGRWPDHVEDAVGMGLAAQGRL